MGKSSPSTQELWKRLLKTPSIESFLSKNADACVMPTFADYITALCVASGERPEHVINRSGIERSFGHRLFSGGRRPSRDTVLRLAFAFGLDADAAQELLEIAQASRLQPRVERDAVIAFCLHHHLSLMDAQQMLYDRGLPLMGSRTGR